MPGILFLVARGGRVEEQTFVLRLPIVNSNNVRATAITTVIAKTGWFATKEDTIIHPHHAAPTFILQGIWITAPQKEAVTQKSPHLPLVDSHQANRVVNHQLSHRVNQASAPQINPVLLQVRLLAAAPPLPQVALRVYHQSHLLRLQVLPATNQAVSQVPTPQLNPVLFQVHLPVLTLPLPLVLFQVSLLVPAPLLFQVFVQVHLQACHQTPQQCHQVYLLKNQAALHQELLPKNPVHFQVTAPPFQPNLLFLPAYPMLPAPSHHRAPPKIQLQLQPQLQHQFLPPTLPQILPSVQLQVPLKHPL